MNSFETSCFVRHATDNTFSIHSSTEKGYGMSETNQSFDGKSFFIGVLATFVVGLLMGANNNIGWNKKQEWEILSKTIVSDIEKEVSEATGTDLPRLMWRGMNHLLLRLDRRNRQRFGIANRYIKSFLVRTNIRKRELWF